MMLLVALSVLPGVALLLSPLIVLRYVLSRPVVFFMLCYVALLAAPLLYAWRTRPFRQG